MDGRFVAYYRVSTGKQGRSGLGLDAQKHAVTSFLNGGAWELKGEFTEVESGRNAARPELAKALSRCRVTGSTLIVANVSRLTRSVAFLSRLLEEGADVRFCDLPQIEGPTGRFMLQQMAAVAELEAGFIGDRTRAALARAKAKGTKLGKPENLTRCDVGRERGRAAQVERAMRYARDLAPIIGELRSAGATSYRQIAAGLEARGISTKPGGTKKMTETKGRWTAAQVGRVLERLAV